MYVCVCVCNGLSLGFTEASLEPLISGVGGGRTKEEAKWLQPVASVHPWDKGSEVLPAQHLFAGLRYIHNDGTTSK